MMPDFMEYSTALAGLMVLVLIQMVLSPITGLAKGKAGIAPGCEPEAEYGNKTYRVHRLYANTAENLAPMAIAMLAAMALGVSAWAVGILVWVHVVARIVYGLILNAGIGKPHSGVRSVAYVVGWAANVLLAIAVLVKVVSG